MKKIIVFIIPILMLVMTSFSECEKQPDNNKKVVKTTPFVLGCDWTNVPPNIVHIINSAEELANYINCENELPQIDFSKQTLLAATGIVGGGVSKETAELSKTGTEYSLNIDILLDDTAVVGSPWRTALLINKLEINHIELVVSSHH
jgi:hypothetical protein